MVSIFGTIRKVASRLALASAALWLAACDPTMIAGGPVTGQKIDPSAPVRVALLIPSGSGQGQLDIIARDLENAAKLAVADLDGVAIDLRVYSTGGSPAQAASVATRAVDDGAKIILGPLFAEGANAAGLAVASRNVNVLSFSNNTDIAGRNVFVLGNSFRNTANRLVGFAARQGKGRILIVHEQTPAGDVGRRAIEAAIANSRATLAGVQSHAFSQAGVTAAVPSIVNAARASGADSVFLTSDAVGALPFLAQMLPERGLSPATTQYMGLTRWDIPPATLALPGVQGGWFALPDPGRDRQFRSRFQAAYGVSPNPVAGLAYDGIAAIGALVKSGRANALTSTALTQASGFQGVNGIFRLRPDGTTERGLAVAEVRNNQVVVIDPAPRSFSGAGF